MNLWIEFAFSAGYLAMLRGKAESARQTRREAAGTTQKTTQKTMQARILTMLRANASLSREALARQTGLTADGVKYHLEKLKAAGRLQRVGPDKGGHWEVLL